MFRFLRRAALIAVAGGALYAATTCKPSEPLPHSGSSSSPLITDATGHLALVRAHPDLRELNALLTPRAFLLDATQALLAGALRRAPYSTRLRQGHDFISGQILSAEAKGNTDQAAKGRLQLALLDACDGRLEDALDTCARLAAEHPHFAPPRYFAAAFCQMLGRPEEGARWLQGFPDLSRPNGKKNMFIVGVVVAAVGCGPRDNKLVLVTMLGLTEMAMWSIFKDGDLPERLQVLAFMAFLRHVVAKNLANDVAQGSQNATPS